jgi:isoleucyl-tRNA synthetase
MDPEIRSHVADELNVLDVADLSSAGGDLVDISIKANFRSIGARYGADVQAIAAAIGSSDATTLVRTLRSGAEAKLNYSKDGDQKVAALVLDDLVVTETPKSGWSVSSHSGESVALDLELTPDLIQAGLVREVIRAIQEERKNSGFDISDRITVEWNAGQAIAEAIASATETIAEEVLATGFERNSTLPQSENEIGLALHLRRN